MDGRDARLGTRDGDTSGGTLRLELDSPVVTVADVLDDRGFHSKLDDIHWHEPADILKDRQSATS